MATLNLKFSECGYGGRRDKVDTKNEVFEYLIDQLRRHVNNDPYKQQCEDLAHEVLSLKNQLRDASALVAELQETIKLMNEDVEAYKLIRGQEQSGFRKEDEWGCEHEWEYYHPNGRFCTKCGDINP